MPSHPAKKPNLEQEAQQELRFWTTSLKTQMMQPNKYYAQRQPKLDNRRTWIRTVIWSLIPILIFSVLFSVIEKRYMLIPAYVVLAYAGMALWAYVQSFLLRKLFDREFNFRQCFDLALTAAPALAIAWIPTAGVVASSILACFWNYAGLVNQFKIDKGAGLAAATLPVVIAGAAIILLGYFAIVFLYVGNK
ncbi:MAG: hypothetical protein K2Y22_02905 [Candidatus Obscuribacterales bacterium]|nr:hypothetical protein [Candidatus Obscuribacterales bacterium]